MEVVQIKDRGEVLNMLPFFCSHFHCLGIKDFDPEYFIGNVLTLIESGNGFVVAIRSSAGYHGAIVAVLFRDFSLNRLMCSEVFFRVFKEGLLKSKELIEEFEDIGKCLGAEGFQLCLTKFYKGDHKKAHNFYLRRGYSEQQTVFYKISWELQKP